MMQAEPALRRDGVIAAESSVNREVSGNQTVFEDVAATVGKMALAAGCEEFDTKPVEFDRLLGRIRKLVSGRVV